jgi:hypothetical protein
LKEG